MEGKVEVYFRIDFDMVLAMKEGYEALQDHDGDLIKLARWNKKQ